jgi:hypothetical protein
MGAHDFLACRQGGGGLSREGIVVLVVVLIAAALILVTGHECVYVCAYMPTHMQYHYSVHRSLSCGCAVHAAILPDASPQAYSNSDKSTYTYTLASDAHTLGPCHACMQAAFLIRRYCWRQNPGLVALSMQGKRHGEEDATLSESQRVAIIDPETKGSGMYAVVKSPASESDVMYVPVS